MIFTSIDAVQLSMKSDVLQMDERLLYPIFDIIKQCCSQGEFECTISTDMLDCRLYGYIVDRLKFFGYEVDEYSGNINIIWR